MSDHSVRLFAPVIYNCYRNKPADFYQTKLSGSIKVGKLNIETHGAKVDRVQWWGKNPAADYELLNYKGSYSLYILFNPT